ncbi:MAG: hypothetical protein EA361_01030 [Bacteroidetes bacterium]|nr:MAG: hypothetical protein EA361_01030 [Bacteroidota bacterium]
MRHIVWLILGVILFSTSARAIGYHPSLSGMQSSGMGSLYSGLSISPEAVWLNPAALSAMDSRYSLSMGLNFSQSFTKFQNSAPSIYQANSDNSVFLPYHIYFSASLNERISIGFAFNNPFASQIKWQEENWIGRFLVKESEYLVTVYQPTIAYAITDNLHIGAGLIIAKAGMRFKKAIPYRDSNREGSVEITDNALQYGVNAGIFLQPIEKVKIGLSFRSRLQFQFNNSNAQFNVPGSLQPFFPESVTAASNASTPALLDLTGSYQLAENTILNAGIAFVFKRTTGDNNFLFTENNTYLTNINTLHTERNGVILRLGTEYGFTDFLFFRAGMYYQSATADNDFFFPANPDLNRLAFTAGGSFLPAPGLSIGLSVVYSAGLEKSATYMPANFAGNYKSSSFIPGIGLSYAL